MYVLYLSIHKKSFTTSCKLFFSFLFIDKVSPQMHSTVCIWWCVRTCIGHRIYVCAYISYRYLFVVCVVYSVLCVRVIFNIFFFFFCFCVCIKMYWKSKERRARDWGRVPKGRQCKLLFITFLRTCAYVCVVVHV